MRGQTVVCKDFTGNLLVRTVWENSAGFVFIHTDEQFSAHQNNFPHLAPVGFPIEDVFLHDSRALESRDPWKALIPYSEQARSTREVS